MYKWIRKLHLYSGLLSFTALIVWGVIGVHGAFSPAPGEFQPPAISDVRETLVEEAGGLDDQALARFIYEQVEIPLRGGFYNVHRDDEQNLSFFVFTASGRYDLTFNERSSLVTINVRRNNLFGFLSTMHTANARRGPRTIPARMWAIYNEFSTWALLFMMMSGVYLWLCTRPHLHWARWTGLASLFSATILWIITR